MVGLIGAGTEVGGWVAWIAIKVLGGWSVVRVVVVSGEVFSVGCGREIVGGCW